MVTLSENILFDIATCRKHNNVYSSEWKSTGAPCLIVEPAGHWGVHIVVVQRLTPAHLLQQTRELTKVSELTSSARQLMKSNPSTAGQIMKDFYNFFVKIKCSDGDWSQHKMNCSAVSGYLNMMVMYYLRLMDGVGREQNINNDCPCPCLQRRSWSSLHHKCQRSSWYTDWGISTPRSPSSSHQECQL